jgi:hypothetical protein
MDDLEAKNLMISDVSNKNMITTRTNQRIMRKIFNKTFGDKGYILACICHYQGTICM